MAAEKTEAERLAAWCERKAEEQRFHAEDKPALRSFRALCADNAATFVAIATLLRSSASQCALQAGPAQGSESRTGAGSGEGAHTPDNSGGLDTRHERSVTPESGTTQRVETGATVPPSDLTALIAEATALCKLEPIDTHDMAVDYAARREARHRMIRARTILTDLTSALSAPAAPLAGPDDGKPVDQEQCDATWGTFDRCRLPSHHQAHRGEHGGVWLEDQETVEGATVQGVVEDVILFEKTATVCVDMERDASAVFSVGTTVTVALPAKRVSRIEEGGKQ